MNRILYIFFLITFTRLTCNAQHPLPSTSQMKWHEAELGVLFSYDLHVFDNMRYNQHNNRINPVADYQIFNPQRLDTDQWIKAAKDAGARFVVITATHETGFAIYQSDVNPYCLKALKWQDGKGDIVRDFVNSCRKYDIQPGIYIGIRWNSLLGIHNFKVEGESDFARNRQTWYKRFCERMVEDNLMNMYYQSVGRNATLILGLTPDPDGLLPIPDVNRLQEFGNHVRQLFSQPVKSTSGTGRKIELKLGYPQVIDHCVIQEEITKGERVRKYKIEGKNNNKWVTLCSGMSIGYKRIEKFDPQVVTEVRLMLEESTDIPQIVHFSVYSNQKIIKDYHEI